MAVIIGSAAGGVTVYPSTGYIPDTSANNGAFYPARIAKNCAFVIMRARVSGKTDATYKARAAALQTLGFPHWAYDFVKTTGVEDAIKQADAMYGLCQPCKPIGYYLDVEQYAPGITCAKSREHVKAYVAQLRKRAQADGIAIKIGCYMGTARHARYKALDGLFDTLWPATWGNNDGFVNKIPDYGDLHQYTSAFASKPADYGCPGGRDMNRLTGRKPLSFFTGRQHDGTGYVGLVQMTGKVNLRQGPGTNHKILATIPKGKYATRRAGDADWYAVNWRGGDGFVSAQYAKVVKEG